MVTRKRLSARELRLKAKLLLERAKKLEIKEKLNLKLAKAKSK